MTSQLRIEDHSASHVGEVRSQNEDSHADLPYARVWVVADGMGGHANGKFASQTITEQVAEGHYPDDLEAACNALSAMVQEANAKILAKSQELGAQMGSTFVGLVLRGQEFVTLWAGDSRAYLYRHGHLVQLTVDHTQVQAMIDRGLLSVEEAHEHPMRHVLARAVGVEEILEIDAITDRVEPGDIFLLCSDGLHGLVSDAEIAAILAKSGAHGCDELISVCLARGAPDNVTVTLVSATEPTLVILNGAAL